MDQTRLVTGLEALSEKYSKENCIADEFEHIQLTLKQRTELKTSGIKSQIQCIVDVSLCLVHVIYYM